MPFRSDLRTALRALRRRPLFTLTAVLALALGLGAATAVTGVVDGILVRPLPYADADRLVVLLHGGDHPVAPANFLDWRREARGFQAMAAAEAWGATLTGPDAAERLRAIRVTPGMFALLGVRPLLGRAFAPDEPAAEAVHEVVLGHAIWQRRFGGDRTIVGRTIVLDGEPRTVIGVMPPGFRFAPFWATRAELWGALDLAPRADSRRGQSLRVFARLAPGTTLAQARAGLSAVTARLERDFPGTNGDVTITPLKEKVVGDVRPLLLVLAGAVACVLLVACANVAHMLLARGSARRRELALRTALGATRGGLVRQLLLESVLLALAGGAAGAALGALGVRALVALAPAELPRLEGVTVDGRVLLAALAATLLTALACGLPPALRSTAAVEGALRDGGRGSRGGRGQQRARRLLVASEFAMALVLLAGAGLMVRSLVALQHVDPGFDPRGVLAAEVTLTGTAHADPARRAPFLDALVARVAALPGVRAASMINHVPLAGDVWGTSFHAAGGARDSAGRATYRVVLPGYFRTMGIRLRAGRDVEPGDRAETPGVVVVNATLARRWWPGEPAVGQRLALGDAADGGPWLTVVGVVDDVVRGDWTAPPAEEVYLPWAQRPDYREGTGAAFTTMTLVARTGGDAAALAPAVRAIVHELDPGVPVSEVQGMPAVVRQATARSRFLLSLLATFAAAAVALAGVGLWAVTSYTVTQRVPEIGIRLALGASRQAVVRLVMGEAAVVAIAGTAAGLVGALALARLLASLLYGVAPRDPATLAAVAAALAVVALAASWGPVRRALRVDPSVALRAE